MDALTNAMEATFAWVWQSSLEASLVVLLILAARLVTPRRHAATLFPALWLLLIAHMLLPWRPESALSIANVLQRSEAMPQVESLPVTIEFASTTPELRSVAETAPSTVLAPPLTEVSSTSDPVFLIAFACWLGGLLFILMIVMRRYAVFKRAMRQTSRPANPAIQSTVDECRVAMGMRKSPRVLITHDAVSPALVGIFRPTLLISESMLDRFTDAEWRCVISHELAHLKRHDIALNWLTTLLQAIHWFNPLVWYAFRRMRSDREIACDALALASTSPSKSTLYAETLIKLLKVHANPRPLVGVAMILESKSNLERRMNMIMRFNPAQQRWSILSILMVCLVALSCLTNAQTVADDPAASEEKVVGYTQLESAEIDEVIGKIEDAGTDYVPVEDPYEKLTKIIRKDWEDAVESIQKNDRELFKAHVMHSESSLVFFDGMRSVLTLFPDAIHKLAVVGYSRPQPNAGIRDAFVCAGPFRVKTSADVEYSTLEEGQSVTFSLKTEHDYYLYVQLTNEKEEEEEEVSDSAEYRFQTPILPQTLEECIGNVVPIKVQLDLGDKDYHIYAFNREGDAIKKSILEAWSDE